ncbi:hypothetical protein Y032_0027g1562 [Ancylostoma ceylanicum]|nr:hypothetical protein Y032_0027g1562 [Ancylostoma ceylanicum]
MVPIVLRRKILEDVGIPPDSFIAVDDFKKLNQLGAYLNHLRSDDSAYLRFCLEVVGDEFPQMSFLRKLYAMACPQYFVDLSQGISNGPKDLPSRLCGAVIPFAPYARTFTRREK